MNQMTKDGPLGAVRDEIESHLLGLKRAATLEIRNYPQPIAGCDAQIPALWEKRDGIAAELDRLAEARKHLTREAISDFIATSSFMDDDQKQTLHALVPPDIRSAAE